MKKLRWMPALIALMLVFSLSLTACSSKNKKKVKNAIQEQATKAATTVQGAGTQVATHVQGAETKVATAVQGAGTKVATNVQGAATQVATRVQGGATQVATNVQGAGTQAAGAVSSAGGTAQAVLTGDPNKGQQLFTSQGCVNCHATQGDQVIVGPSLAGVADRAGQRVQGMSAADYLHQSLVDPGAFVVPNFSPGIMPSFAKLSDDDLNNLVAYLMTLHS